MVGKSSFGGGELSGNSAWRLMKSFHPRVPVLAPAEFRRRIRPYLPGTVLQLRRLWPRARRREYKLGQYFIVGPYCSGCGHKIIWLFRPDGTLASTAESPWLRRHFQIIRLSVGGSTPFLGHGRPDWISNEVPSFIAAADVRLPQPRASPKTSPAESRRPDAITCIRSLPCARSVPALSG